MIMDILVLILFALTIFFAMRRGFVMTVVSFLRGIVTIVIAWFSATIWQSCFWIKQASALRWHPRYRAF